MAIENINLTRFRIFSIQPHTSRVLLSSTDILYWCLNIRRNDNFVLYTRCSKKPCSTTSSPPSLSTITLFSVYKTLGRNTISIANAERVLFRTTLPPRVYTTEAKKKLHFAFPQSECRKMYATTHYRWLPITTRV